MAAPSSTADGGGEGAAGPPRTPDGRYIVHVGRAGPRLWRATDPRLDEGERAALASRLGAARAAVSAAQGDPARLATARAEVDAAKRALGERGPVWWTDGAPDLNRRLVASTPYASWCAARECGFCATLRPAGRRRHAHGGERSPQPGAGSHQP